MNQKEYNGWTNYETWLVKLWQDNDQGSEEYWRDAAEQVVKDHGREDGYQVFADAMKDQYEEQAIEKVGTGDLFSDLMTAALSEVNWYEIAQHWIDEAADALGLEGVEIEE